MANSYFEYPSPLSSATFSVPFSTLSFNDVKVMGYNGSTWTDLTITTRDPVAKTVTLASTPSSFQKIRVWRQTAANQLVDFQSGSRLAESDLDTAYQQGLFVAQEVSENASTVAGSIGATGIQGPQGIQGPAGQDGVDGADGADGADGDDGAFSASFESSEIAIPSSDGVVTATHGLGAVPKQFVVSMRCKTSDTGYDVGDEVYLQTTNNSFISSTGVGFRAASTIATYNKTTDVYATINTANWKLVFRAFA